MAVGRLAKQKGFLIFAFRSPFAHKMKFSQLIIEWYEQNKRMLPWRETKDPYKIWLSEIILQQTRVAQGLPYYLSFVKAFPSVSSLAKAKEQEILRLWQGLGYYSRARNLSRCAKMIVEEFKGKFPDNFDDLQKLIGVGPYTAAAIASIAFNQRVAVVDGNVFRVIARIFGIDADIASSEGKKIFFSKANELISKEHPDLFNQAMMEFGATWCTPKNPKCDECIFKKSCIAYKTGTIALLPVKEKKRKMRKRFLNYVIIERKKKIAMKRREDKDIWRGLFDFYLVETKKVQKPQQTLEKNLKQLTVKEYKAIPLVKHVLSHQLLSIQFIWIKLNEKNSFMPGGMKFYSQKEVKALPKPIVISNYLEGIGFIFKE
jgi:A/G-specific adenine glycosylase